MKSLWPAAVLVAIILVVAGRFIYGRYDAAVAAWEVKATTAVARADAATKFADSVKNENRVVQEKTKAALHQVAERDKTIAALKATRSELPVPDTCVAVAAVRDSIIADQDSTIGDLKTALQRQIVVAADLQDALQRSDSALVQERLVIKSVPKPPSRFLPRVQVTAGLGPKGPDVVVGLGWSL